MRLDRSWVEHIARILASTVVHEAQHVNSVYKRLLNSLEDPFSYMAQHPVWVEEGRAVMAAEAASRLAWADLGGPASHEQATAAHIAGLSDREVGVAGILEALSRVKYVLREDDNSLTHFPDPYGSGWHLHRLRRRLVRWRGPRTSGRRRVHQAAHRHGDAARCRRDRRGHRPPLQGADARVRHGDLAGRHRCAPAAGSGTVLDLRFHGAGGAGPRHLLLGRAGALPLARDDERRGTGCQALGAARVFPDDRTADQGGRHPGLRPPRLGARRGGNPRDRRAGPCGDRRGPGFPIFPGRTAESSGRTGRPPHPDAGAQPSPHGLRCKLPGTWGSGRVTRWRIRTAG